MRTRYFSQFPKPYTAYPKIIKGLVSKNKTSAQSLPDVEYVVDAFHVHARHLHAYNKICGFENNGSIPAMYFAVLSQSLQMHMMTQEAFPFAILGLVHIHNQVTQHARLAANLQYQLSCKFGELKPHAKGVQFEFITQVKLGADVVMEGVSTYLSRQKSADTPITINKTELRPAYVLKDTWQIPENIGRRYALISGDANMIHLHAFTAKAFGFKRAIAHGMWTKAKALASLDLPEQYQAEVHFKTPVFLPSTVELLTVTQAKQTDFLLQHPQTTKPHLEGCVIAL
ncbi:MaoC family dehydratase [Acinetobacter sp. MD2(2019)]|uniref:MaoC family dehydratase n=1 Tax=Acinetobacter sp. MD2(2019) TaxID=2605273 RepID=UPI002D1F2B62|nr:MaoC/PaaZ C-terminal domain-containing protein [Acinetobacter sp. MD2(2019)]MEB3752756.1 hypothetical protein [Acinetobacter sp. MD2(2019)]